MAPGLALSVTGPLPGPEASRAPAGTVITVLCPLRSRRLFRLICILGCYSKSRGQAVMGGSEANIRRKARTQGRLERGVKERDIEHLAHAEEIAGSIC
jgi:hypothetical protein